VAFRLVDNGFRESEIPSGGSTLKTMKPESKRYRAVVTVEFEAASREAAVAHAKELIDRPDAKVRIQESTVAWLTVPDQA
jgi:hypothetical protein